MVMGMSGSRGCTSPLASLCMHIECSPILSDIVIEGNTYPTSMLNGTVCMWRKTGYCMHLIGIGSHTLIVNDNYFQ